MAIRPLAFGARLRDKGRTVRVDCDETTGRYRVEDQREGKATRRRRHASKQSALRDLARTWRSRLH